MKNIIILIAALITTNLMAQQKEVSIPFSSPSDSKSLHLDIFNGSLKIIGTNRSDVLIKYEIVKQEDDDKNVPDEAKGMKKIGSSNFNFEISEKKNQVNVRAQNFMNILRMEIEVPSTIDLNIIKQIGENIDVENIKGDINIENNIGSVSMLKIDGSVNASSSTGNITVQFDRIDPAQAMTFNTITGNIDLTIPKSHKADFKMKTEWGDVYSDLNVATSTWAEEKKDEKKEGNLKVITNQWTKGVLNGGGSEMTLKTTMGSIYLRGKE